MNSRLNSLQLRLSLFDLGVVILVFAAMFAMNGYQNSNVLVKRVGGADQHIAYARYFYGFPFEVYRTTYPESTTDFYPIAVVWNLLVTIVLSVFGVATARIFTKSRLLYEIRRCLRPRPRSL
jgi:hypothetical protein